MGSSLVFDRIISLSYRVTLTYFNAEAHGFIPTPSAIGKKKAVVNVKTDVDCFKYAVLAALHHDDIPHGVRHRRTAYRQWEGELKFDFLTPSEL